MPNEEKPTTPQAAPPPVPPEPEAGSPPPVAKGGGPASGAGEPKPLSAKEHAAIEKAKYEAREAKRALKERDAKAAEELKVEREARQREAERASAMEKRLAELEEKFKKPLHGRPDAEQVIRDYVEGETPEKRTAAEIAEAKRIAEETRQELEKERQDRKREREENQARAAAAASQAAVDNFVKAVTGDEAKTYVYLSAMHSPNEIRSMAAEIQHWAVAEGKTFTFEQIASHLDKRAKNLYDERKERLSALHAAEAGGQAAAGLAPPVATGRAGNGSAGNGHRNGPGTDASPKRQSARLTREQEAEEDLAILRKAQAADAAERNRQAKASKPH